LEAISKTGVKMLPQRDAIWLVALNTLLHEIGVPVPITPIVLVAGAGSSRAASIRSR
jgi:hypothetical protein